DADEIATIVFSDANGVTLGQATVTQSDLDPGGILNFTNANGVVQFNVIAGAGDEFYVDDIFFV
ncbi:MAG: hypothetical protein OEY05_15795, partial [Paracoccaceae bacterium]|nr:hypothetical protein [Paracoccaceae bacterium]